MTKATHEAAMAEEVQNYAAMSQPIALFGKKSDGGAKTKFCAVWPAAREGLGALELMVPASLRLIIGIVRGAGDAAAGTVCKTN